MGWIEITKSTIRVREMVESVSQQQSHTQASFEMKKETLAPKVL